MWKYNLSKHSVEQGISYEINIPPFRHDEVKSISVQGKVDWKDGDDVTGKFKEGNGYFSIYSKPGTEVTTDELHITWGYESDKKKAEMYLKPNEIYTIDKIDVHDFSTTVYLKEFENIGFNSVHFISPEIVAIPINIQEQPHNFTESNGKWDDETKTATYARPPRMGETIPTQEQPIESEDELWKDVMNKIMGDTYMNIYTEWGKERIDEIKKQFTITRK